jgi:FKBP-type peptidyl-prolyl cis-trans isomerase (trigger factor)
MMTGYEEMWKNEFEKPLKSQLFNSIMDKIIEDNPFHVPESWVTQEMDLTLKRIGMEQIPTDPTMLESIRNISERSVRIAFLLDKVYEKEQDIHLTSDELEKLAENEGAPHNMSGLEWLDQMRQRGQYEAYVAYQEQQKTIAFLIESAEVEDEEDNDSN